MDTIVYFAFVWAGGMLMAMVFIGALKFLGIF